MTARILHTSDWHLGRQIGHRRYRRDNEFDAVLNEIIAIAKHFTPDLIVHSGDLFDSWRPSLHDLRRAADTLRLLGRIAPTVVVAGNHDTRAVLNFLEYVLDATGGDTDHRVRFATDSYTGGLLVAEYPTAAREQTIRIGALPYLHPNRFTYDFDDPSTATASFAHQMRHVQADAHRRLAAERGPADILVYAAHLYVEGATVSRSERPISVSEDFAVAAAGLPLVDYGALGHIHKPQSIDSVGFPARYAGSPLQLDFGETHDTKSVVLAEIEPGTDPLIELVPLTTGRRLVNLTGTLDEIAQRASRVSDAWVKAIVDTDRPTTNLSETLAAMLPKATIVDIQERRAGATSPVLDRSAATEEVPSTTDLLHDYLLDRKVTGRRLDHAMAALAQIQAAPDPGEGVTCCEEDLLAAALGGHGLDHVDRTGLLLAAADCSDGSAVAK
ncbi:Nuclease SbcCD subunit D [Nocardia cerradoensis]|uniref:Nuclease SbcCD subunit D n=1 Tax=Nocardia cerradoensis TaxID=85688 RepID=A0A231GX14_9NOCA|nr:exonuclease SbcCD subunit D [Nocardia cerradoensis]OXR41118.1 Nuclease SbcCD subunit D [Nocardia cerradoensis]